MTDLSTWRPRTWITVSGRGQGSDLGSYEGVGAEFMAERSEWRVGPLGLGWHGHIAGLATAGFYERRTTNTNVDYVCSSEGGERYSTGSGPALAFTPASWFGLHLAAPLSFALTQASVRCGSSSQARQSAPPVQRTDGTAAFEPRVSLSFNAGVSLRASGFLTVPLASSDEQVGRYVGKAIGGGATLGLGFAF